MNIVWKCGFAVFTAMSLGATPADGRKSEGDVYAQLGHRWRPYTLLLRPEIGTIQKAGIDLEIETGRGSAASAQKVGAGSSQLGLSDMAGVLLFRGKGADLVGVMNVCTNSPQGLYWLNSSGIKSVKDLAGKENRQSGWRWCPHDVAGSCEGQQDRSASVTWVNIDANAKLGALKAKTIDATTSFYNLHHVFTRELGKDMGFLAWKDAGVDPTVVRSLPMVPG